MAAQSAHDVLQTLLDNPQMSAYDVVLANAKTYIKGDFAAGWRKALHDGWVDGTAFTAKAGGAAKSAAARAAMPQRLRQARWRFRSGPIRRSTMAAIANVGWLQELPKQVTNLSWDNAALMSINTMDELKLEQSDAVEIDVQRPQGDCSGADGSGSSGRRDHGASWLWPRRGGGPRGRGCRLQCVPAAHVGCAALGSRRKADARRRARTTCASPRCTTSSIAAASRSRIWSKKLSTQTGVYSLAGHEAMERVDHSLRHGGRGEEESELRA